MKDWIRLLRPRHFVKNVLVFLPLVFGGRLAERAPLRAALRGFAAFCLLSSVVYIINDIRDAESDRRHPVKCRRPIASGAVSASGAAVLAAALLALVAAIALLCRLPLTGWVWLGAYLLLNVAYSCGLKHVPIVDIVILASGFVLRVLFGAAVTGIEISGWLYLTVLAVSFYLGLGKRRNELRRQKDGARPVLKYYNDGFLDKNMHMFLTLAIVFYSLWSIGGTEGSAASGRRMFWTVPLVLCICLKYSLTVEGDSDGDPVEVLYRDKILLALVAAFALVLLALLYL